jgi:hypothetical protein
MVGLTGVLFVTDIDHGRIPIVGETIVERAANFEGAVWKARHERLASAAMRFYYLVRQHLPTIADERALAPVRSEIVRMCEAGYFYEPKCDEMLSSLAFAEDGNVAVHMVDRWGNVLEFAEAS